MSNDILESVSQGGYGACDAENRRIREISDELQRLCRLHEKESRDSKGYGSRFEIEQRVAEQYAKSTGMWIPMDKVFDLGVPRNVLVDADGDMYVIDAEIKGMELQSV